MICTTLPPGGVCSHAERWGAAEGPGQGGEHGGTVRCPSHPQVQKIQP